MIFTEPNRRVLTFYSYKGGVGRTMALANVAYRLANTHGLSVIAVDWDLEAPGLHRFFGVSPDVAGSTSGILDYFVAWRDAVARNAPEPPPEVERVLDWLIPITDEKHAPRFGSLRVLLAGRLDKTYGDRLAGFHWQDFYSRTEGSAAVETLREKLVENADVVLIDSRTGLTDIGGICTIQLPDGVVLLTAPNHQSFEGTERVARAIDGAPEKERAGREKPRVWLAVSRVPLVEESYLADEWFGHHNQLFEKGVQEGLWFREDHPDGIRTHALPHRARWGFEEKVLREGGMVDSKDPLVLAYEQLTGTLLRWLRKWSIPIPQPLADASTLSRPEDIAALQEEAAAAEQRGDTIGLAITLYKLAEELHSAQRHEEGIRKIEQAIGIFLSRGAYPEHARALHRLGDMLLSTGRVDESEEALRKSLTVARQVDEKVTEAGALTSLAAIRFHQGNEREAADLIRQMDTIEKRLIPGEPGVLEFFIYNIFAFYRTGRKEQAAELSRRIMSAARATGRPELEAFIEKLLTRLGNALPGVSDVPVPRPRTDEQESDHSQNTASDQATSTRHRTGRKRTSSSPIKRSGGRSR
ncbi:KGGVGR-motif variant AAA ATPase [Sorangium cellulosum]|uniref:KGGVGR-motif variant AAA ATPase n=1 Tax=Sorangium cellulosum TaxID=56 RepID=UPI0005D2BC08|nr:tetratricopeptide repeat protein [Sorangium cellulosum]